MEPEGALLHSQVAATSPYPKPDQSNPCTTILLPEKFILLLSSHLRLGLTGGIFPSSSPPPKKTLYAHLSRYVLHAPTVPFFPMLSPEQILDEEYG